MLFAEDLLDLATCPDPNCTADHSVLLTSECHQGAPVRVLFRKDGALHLLCGVCSRLITRVSVGHRPTLASIQPNPDIASIN